MHGNLVSFNLFYDIALEDLKINGYFCKCLLAYIILFVGVISYLYFCLVFFCLKYFHIMDANSSSNLLMIGGLNKRGVQNFSQIWYIEDLNKQGGPKNSWNNNNMIFKSYGTFNFIASLDL